MTNLKERLLIIITKLKIIRKIHQDDDDTFNVTSSAIAGLSKAIAALEQNAARIAELEAALSTLADSVERQTKVNERIICRDYPSESPVGHVIEILSTHIYIFIERARQALRTDK